MLRTHHHKMCAPIWRPTLCATASAVTTYIYSCIYTTYMLNDSATVIHRTYTVSKMYPWSRCFCANNVARRRCAGAGLIDVSVLFLCCCSWCFGEEWGVRNKRCMDTFLIQILMVLCVYYSRGMGYMEWFKMNLRSIFSLFKTTWIYIFHLLDPIVRVVPRPNNSTLLVQIIILRETHIARFC